MDKWKIVEHSRLHPWAHAYVHVHLRLCPLCCHVSKKITRYAHLLQTIIADFNSHLNFQRGCRLNEVLRIRADNGRKSKKILFRDNCYAGLCSMNVSQMRICLTLGALVEARRSVKPDATYNEACKPIKRKLTRSLINGDGQ